MYRKKLRSLVFMCTLIILLGSITGCQSSELVNISKKTYALGTHITLSVWTNNQNQGNKAIEESFKRIIEIEERMSANIETSDVSKINENAGMNPVDVHKDTAFVINKSLEYAKLSNGTFDPTIGKLVKLWGIGSTSAEDPDHKIPSEKEISDALNYIDYNLLKNIGSNSFLLEKANASIDLGGIAKGYAADEVYSILKNNGINHALINLGGNVLTLGTKADGTKWRVGIQNPYEPTGTHLAIIEIADQTVVTSGNYERYFIKDDIRYHHILDTKTGYPAQKGIISSTIITDSSIDADALSTSVYALGVEEGLKLIESLENTETLIITEDNKVYLSSGLDKIITIVDNNFSLAE